MARILFKDVPISRGHFSDCGLEGFLQFSIVQVGMRRDSFEGFSIQQRLNRFRCRVLEMFEIDHDVHFRILSRLFNPSQQFPCIQMV